MALTPEQKRQNRFDRMCVEFCKIGPGKQKSKTAVALQKAIRMEDANEMGECRCVTCGKRDHFKRVHAGHFVASRSNGVLFDERNVHVQCIRCNNFLGGNQESYYQYMLDNYGQDVIDEIRANRNKVVKFALEELVEMRLGFLDRIKVQEKRLANSDLYWGA